MQMQMHMHMQICIFIFGYNGAEIIEITNIRKS